MLGLKGASSFTTPEQLPYTSGVVTWRYFFKPSHFRSSSWSRTLATTLVWYQCTGVSQLSATMLWAAKFATYGRFLLKQEEYDRKHLQVFL